MKRNRWRWWDGGVAYQIYPRSWADSDGDGAGDLRGIIEHLDHLTWLGVDALWLNPIHPSPNADWGYDVADYYDVHPDFGTLADVDELVSSAAARDIAVVLDLVPNHTSSAHDWFVDARSGRDAARREWYVWADPAPDGGPPNNWQRVLGAGPAWTLDEATGQYYLHNFVPDQPDLNWWNEEVRDEFDRILRFWFDRGIAGFRVDVVHALVHDPELRDNPPTTPEDHPQVARIGQQQVYNMNRPEVHEIVRRWRALCDSYQQTRALVGETYLFELEELARYYGATADELHLAFNFPFVFADFDAAALGAIVDDTLRVLPRHAVPVWTASNHDAGRLMTRWCGDHPRRARCALMILLTLPGVCFLYYGDEIAMPEVPIPKERIVDPAGVVNWPRPGRDPGRTPMQWDAAPGAGFTTPEAEPWLPLGDQVACSVAAQRDAEDSVLHLTRALIELRRDAAFAGGTYEALHVEGGTWGYRRGDGYEIWVNLSDAPADVQTHGEIVVATARDAVIQGGPGVRLAPWSGVVTRLGRR